MKRIAVLLMLCAMALPLMSSLVSAQESGVVVIPESSRVRPEDLGLRAHTNVQLFYPNGVIPDSTQPTGETPSSLGCIYGVVDNPQAGCPKNGTSVPTGGKGVVVIVDAFHYPTAGQDLAHFAETFGMPAPKFKQVHTGAQVPPADCGWETEMALDIEWAYAMAPNAKIILVEAQSNSFAHLLKAVDKAGRIIDEHGGRGEISMSWQGSEFHQELKFDSHFQHPNVVYFASSGDSGGRVGYPSTSPYIVSVGGTRINRDGNGNFVEEIGWSGSGGGNSVLEPRPSYQDAVKDIVGDFRGTPDFSYDADPFSGASVYDSNPACGSRGWFVVGGTSLSSPATAGLVNAAGKFKKNTKAENHLVYLNLGDDTKFTDIVKGRAGQFGAGPGWDFVTGVGTPVGYKGK
jgi:kumamolisin